MPYADTVEIAATTAGVAGTITTNQGARLRKINLAWTNAANADVPTVIEISWTGAPRPMRFVPNCMALFAGTPVGGGATFMSDADGVQIPLDVVMEKTDQLTITVTSTGNLTVQVGVEWD
jgi:hypothetical protein